MSSQSGGLSASAHKRASEMWNKRIEAQAQETSPIVPGSMISMTGEVSPISPRSKAKLNPRKPKVLPAPSSFDALVSPQRRFRNSIAVTQQIPSYASPGLAASAFRKKSDRARSPEPNPPEKSWKSVQASTDKKFTNTVDSRIDSLDFDDTWAVEEEEESNFKKRIHRSISPPPLATEDIPPRPPLSPSEGSDQQTPSRGRRKGQTSSFRDGSVRSISPSISPPSSPQGTKRESMSDGFFSSLTSPNGTGAKFRKRESRSPVPNSAFESPGAVQGNKPVAISGGSVSGSSGPGAKFRKRESMSPALPSSFKNFASPGSLRGRRSIAVSGGLSMSAHNDPVGTFQSREFLSGAGKSPGRIVGGSLRGERSIAVPGSLSSVSSHDGPTGGSLRGERSTLVLGSLSSVSSHDGPGAKFRRRESLNSGGAMSPGPLIGGSLRGERSAIPKRLNSQDGSLRGRRSGFSSRESSISPSVSPVQRKPKSVQALKSTSDHIREDDKLKRRESLSNSFKALETPPSGLGRKTLTQPEQKSLSAHGPSRLRQSIAITEQKSLSSHGPSRLRQSIAITDFSSRHNQDSFDALATPMQRGKKSVGTMYSRQAQDSFDALATPVQRGKKSLGMISEQESPTSDSLSGRKWTSTYLDKPMGGPRGVVKKKERALSPIRTSAHTGSYLDKTPKGGFRSRMSIAGGASTSPVALNQTSGSYWDKSPKGGFDSRVSMSPGALSRKSISTLAMVGSPTLDDTPEDISIQVTIPDIELKIQARMEAKRRQAQDYSMPEHIKKYREREERVRTAQEEKEYRQRELAIAMIYGWAARTRYKNMKRERDIRMAKEAREKAIKELRERSALKIQTAYRMHAKRKRYLHVIGIQRRRVKNAKEIKKIKKLLAKIPKETSNELKAMKKEHIRKKKEMKKELKALKVSDAEQQNQNLIEYLREENRKLKEERHSLQTEHNLLEKQFGLLEKKSAEIDNRFKSLKKFVEHKNETIQKSEAVLQKCRNKYVPNHRRELANRNRHCAAEMRIKEMYKRRLDRILDEVETVAKERELRKDAKRAAREIKRELAKIPVMETPEDLKDLLEELNWTRKYF